MEGPPGGHPLDRLDRRGASHAVGGDRRAQGDGIFMCTGADLVRTFGTIRSGSNSLARRLWFVARSILSIAQV